ncbi:hypothetical protein PRIPAC_74048 [Pristionchus pacificus]|uniref:mannose-6-phosphate isomerase n=1 Tax=Pristionchus pacificus TaxID=54126 RepID=A0A2A6CFK8_PRIPA|nr:hypothetical protein PRIPAC_74048 [Pristionchus pacificus]|eukprot:PDM76880.1 hypothetical protein PRIPAC_42275 [Pristionchus pacificus]
MLKLKCGAQRYAWGTMGEESLVAQLLVNGGHAAEVDKTKPYAELWMGVHPNCPSSVVREGDEILLADLFKRHPELLADHEKGTLQFLFKVLSVNQALSVQTHPTKEQAVALHAADPKNYPDANHKPEMAIAISHFELLCGFRIPSEIVEHLRAYPIGQHLDKGWIVSLEKGGEQEQKEALRSIFTYIWKLPAAEIAAHVETLIKFIGHKRDSKVELSKLELLLVRLNEEYPGGDVGVFAPLLLNYFSLRPGQATFLGPNRPHAYLKGDCVECMACSDNTIRAGLTPKFKDVNTLCANMDYTMSAPPILDRSGGAADTYAPATPEFAVQQITDQTGSFSSRDASSLLLVTNGQATLESGGQKLNIRTGDVIFVPAGTEKVALTGVSCNFFQAWRAFTPRP